MQRILLILLVCLTASACSSQPAPYVPPTDGSLHIYLVRHARAFRNEPHPPGMTAAQLDSLTPHGIEQAGDAADSLAKKHIAIVIASPTHRTIQTGKIISDALRLAPPISEAAFGPMTDSETPASALNRAMAGIRALASQHANQSIVIVTHGDICPLLIGEARNTPLADRMTAETVEPGSVTHLVWLKGHLKLVP